MPPATTFQLTLPIEENSKRKPRCDPYPRLMARFYEPYFLLCSLGRTRNSYTEYPRSGSRQQEMRREYMRNLAFICDGKKGRYTFTAFSVAEVDGAYVFCLASPSPRKCKIMLERSIGTLVEYAITADNKKKKRTVQKFLRKCIEHAKKRVSAYINDVKAAIPACIEKMANKSNGNNDAHVEGLRLLLAHCRDNESGHVDTCVAMYRASKSALMRKLYEEEKLEKNWYVDQKFSGDENGCFARVRHSIGRLASRIHKPLLLLLNAALMQDILQSAKVEVIEQSPCAPKPVADSQTTLPAILRRMFPKDDPDVANAEQALVDLQETWRKPLTRYMDCERECNPFVHSEVSVLEHFYKYKLKFLEGDRYVYCSKPACFACKLYFAEHPARMVVPESHGKVYPNWGPPLIEHFKRKDADSDRQRDLMIKITKTVRDEVVDHLWGRNVPPEWHPDSTTGVSTLEMSLHGLEDDIVASKGDNHVVLYAPDVHYRVGSSPEGELLHEIGHAFNESSASLRSSGLEGYQLHDEDDLDEDNSDEEGGASL
ncbi:hypothetical protein MY5147_009739 [Beauveria neobassiana]